MERLAAFLSSEMCALCLILFLSLLGETRASYSPQAVITNVTRHAPGYSPSVWLHWYFPEYGYGDYANTTRVYTCRYTETLSNFIYEYELVFTLEPEFAKIHYTAEIRNVQAGNVCFQVCALWEDSLEKCSEPYKLDNKPNNPSLQKSSPVFWDQNKNFITYPYILKLELDGSSVDLEWYFPRHQVPLYPRTFVYSCEFSPEDLSFSNRSLVSEIKTQSKDIHTARIPNIPVRWGCIAVCVMSHYFLCGEPAKFDNYLFLPATHSDPQSQATIAPADGTNSDSYDLVFDDYVDYDSYFEQSQPGMIYPKKDRMETANNVSNAVSSSPPFSCSFLSAFIIVVVSVLLIQ